MPRKLTLILGTLLGRLFALTQKSRIEVCHKNLDYFYGKNTLSTSEKESIVSKMYVNLGKNITEYFRLPLFAKEKNIKKWIITRGEDAQNELIQLKTGCILISANYGFWDYPSLAYPYYGKKGCVVTKTIRQKEIHKFWQRFRSSVQAFDALDKKGSATQIIRRIKKNEIITFVLDQNMNDDHGVFVPFGEKEACTLSAAALLARRFDLPVYATFCKRLPDDNYEWISEKVNGLVKTENNKKDIVANTAIFTKHIEKMIKEDPTQWIWNHRRWKHRPLGEEILYPPKKKRKTKTKS